MAWTAESIRQVAGGYGINSPAGTIYVNRSRGKAMRLSILRGFSDGIPRQNARPDLEIVGTADAIADRLNAELGLACSLEAALDAAILAHLQGLGEAIAFGEMSAIACAIWTHATERFKDCHCEAFAESLARLVANGEIETREIPGFDGGTVRIWVAKR